MAWKKAIERLLYKGGLRRRLLLLGLTLLGAALVINTFAGFYYTRKLIVSNSGELQREIAARVALEIEEFIESKLTRLVDFAASASLHGPRSDHQRLLALLLLKNDRAFTELAVLDENGYEVVKTALRRVYLANELSDQSQSEKFKKAASGAAYISPVYTSDRAEPYVTLSVPLKLGPRQIIGAVTAETNLKTLWDVVGNVQFGRAGYAYLVDGRGNLIAHRDSSLVLKRINLSHLREVKEFLQNPNAQDPSLSEESSGISGEIVISTYTPIQKLGWAVVLAEPVAVALAELGTLYRYAGWLLGAGLLVGALIISWVSKRITNPIRTLHLGAQLIGAGSLDHRVDIKSGDEIEELAEGFNKMALELKNSYSTLEQKVEQRTSEASALYEVTKTVNQSLDLDTVLQEVVQRITQMFLFDTTRIYLYDAERECLVLRAFFENHHDPWAAITLFRRRRSVMSQVAESGEAAIFEDVQSDPRCAEWSEVRATRGAGFHFLAVLPIKSQSKVSGAVAFSRREKRTLSDDELRLLSTMCEHLAVAVEKANLFDEVQRRSQHLAVLNTIGAAVSRSLDLDTVLKAASEKIFDTLGFEACWIYILDPAQEELRLKAYKGLSDEIAITMDRRKTSVGVSGRIFQTGQRMVFEDLPNDPHYLAVSSRSRVSSLGFITGAGFPIKAKDTIIGVLHVANKVRRHFAPEELQLIESIAQEVGVAAENARLFAQVNEKTLELAKTNQELLEATRAKSEFIAAMSHELRTPLNIVLGSSELMRDGFFGDLSSGQRDAIDKISRNGRVLLKMINDVLTLSRLDAKKMSLDIATVEVKEIIAHARALVEQINRDNHLEVHWDIDQSVPPLVTDPLKLEEILHNLIANAFKFTPKGRVEVRVCNLPALARVQFSVADTGIGIEAADLGRIFNAFEQLREAHTGDFNGVGLGLSIVKEYLVLMQGDIRVESQPGQGSTFTFSLPCSVALNS